MTAFPPSFIARLRNSFSAERATHWHASASLLLTALVLRTGGVVLQRIAMLPTFDPSPVPRQREFLYPFFSTLGWTGANWK
jgi:hypothetical protein